MNWRECDETRSCCWTGAHSWIRWLGLPHGIVEIDLGTGSGRYIKDGDAAGCQARKQNGKALLELVQSRLHTFAEQICEASEKAGCVPAFPASVTHYRGASSVDREDVDMLLKPVC